jgi:hypothetical protein
MSGITVCTFQSFLSVCVKFGMEHLSLIPYSFLNFVETDSAKVMRLLIKSMTFHSYFLSINFSKRAIHTILSDREFWESWFSKSHTLLTGVIEFLSLDPIFIERCRCNWNTRSAHKMIKSLSENQHLELHTECTGANKIILTSVRWHAIYR